jgi:GT2 family glycosyltransferase
LGNNVPESRRALVYATILYWQTRELPLVERCVESLLAQDVGSGIELRIILVDNGCGGTPRLPSETSTLELIRVPENRGFAGGHNLGMRRAMANGADYMFLFNSDAVAEAGCVRELVAAALVTPSAAFLGPLVLRATAPEYVESAGQSFNRWTGRHRELARGQRAEDVKLCPRTVDAISGCALLVRRTAVDSIGLLDESLFIYFEDMDWCLRAGGAGYESVVVPRARVLHLGQGSTGGFSAFSTFYSVRNHMVVAARYGGPMRGLLLKPLTLGYHVAYLARSPEQRTSQHLAALVQGAWAAVTGQLGARQSSADWN